MKKVYISDKTEMVLASLRNISKQHILYDSFYEAEVDDDFHVNVSGGAIVYNQAIVSGNALVQDHTKVSYNAWVFGNAIIGGSASISDNALVYGDAVILGYSRVYDTAEVYGKAVIEDAEVYDNAMVYGNAAVSDFSSVSGYAEVFGDAWVYSQSSISGNARIYGDAKVSHSTIIRGDEEVDDNRTIVAAEGLHQKAGFCPVCGSPDLHYDSLKVDGLQVDYPWICNTCKSSGEESYDLHFIEHTNIEKGEEI